MMNIKCGCKVLPSKYPVLLGSHEHDSGPDVFLGTSAGIPFHSAVNHNLGYPCQVPHHPAMNPFTHTGHAGISVSGPAPSGFKSFHTYWTCWDIRVRSRTIRLWILSHILDMLGYPCQVPHHPALNPFTHTGHAGISVSGPAPSGYESFHIYWTCWDIRVWSRTIRLWILSHILDMLGYPCQVPHHPAMNRFTYTGHAGIFVSGPAPSGYESFHTYGTCWDIRVRSRTIRLWILSHILDMLGYPCQVPHHPAMNRFTYTGHAGISVSGPSPSGYESFHLYWTCCDIRVWSRTIRLWILSHILDMLGYPCLVPHHPAMNPFTYTGKSLSLTILLLDLNHSQSWSGVIDGHRVCLDYTTTRSI